MVNRKEWLAGRRRCRIEQAKSDALRDEWAEKEGYRLSRGTVGLERLCGVARLRQVAGLGKRDGYIDRHLLEADVGIDAYHMLDHGMVWTRHGRAEALTAHIYGFDAGHESKTRAICDKLELTLEVIPPPAGWYGHGTTMLVYRRPADKGKKLDEHRKSVTK